MKSRLVVMILLATGLMLGFLQTAAADTSCVRMSSRGFCLLSVKSLGSPQAAIQSSQRGTSGGGTEARECRFGFDVVPCSSAVGSWDGVRSCYVKIASPQPKDFIPLSAGREGGVIMECTYLGNSVPAFQFWVETADVAAAPDPRVLAQTAIERMDLQAVRIGSFPYTVEKSPMSLGVVGWNAWMWVDGASATTYGPVTKSASAAGYTVTATAQVAGVVWDMGNGDTVTCGKGTPYPATTEKDPVSPDCGYRYTHDGHYTITATTHWDINWDGIGQSGVIPMELTASEQLAIAEIQVLNVPVQQN